MSFRIKIDFDGQPIAKAKGNKIEDFDDLMDGLKLKFKRGKD